MYIFSCVEAFPGSRAFLQNASKLWWSQRNHVLKCFCVFSCVQLGFRYLVMLRVYVVFVAFSRGDFFCCRCFLSVTSVRSTVFSNYSWTFLRYIKKCSETKNAHFQKSATIAQKVLISKKCLKSVQKQKTLLGLSTTNIIRRCCK